MKKDYHKLEKYTEVNFAKGFLDYPECMLLAAMRLELTDIVVYCGGTEGYYSGEMDIHLEAKLNGKNIYFYLKQEYGSCSYCDWLAAVGEDEVINEYVKNLKLALEI